MQTFFTPQLDRFPSHEITLFREYWATSTVRISLNVLVKHDLDPIERNRSPLRLFLNGISKNKGVSDWSMQDGSSPKTANLNDTCQ
jgi:hypothetical protein